MSSSPAKPYITYPFVPLTVTPRKSFVLTKKRPAITYDQWEDFNIKAYLNGMDEPIPHNVGIRRQHFLDEQKRYAALIQYIITNWTTVRSARTTEQLADAKWRYRATTFHLFRFKDLPVEIITNIFRFVSWMTRTAQEGIKRRLQLTWVCRQWRQLAIADQTLWSAIWFEDAAPFLRSLMFFERAGTSLLDLRIGESMAYMESFDVSLKLTGSQMEQLMDVIITKAEQLRTLVIVVQSWPPVFVALDRLHRAGHRMLNLERLEIHRFGSDYIWLGPGYSRQDYLQAMTVCGGTAPSLRRVCFSGVDVEWEDSPLTNLTTLTLCGLPPWVQPSLERFREILISSPNLRKLVLDRAGPRISQDSNYSLDPSISPIVLPNLNVVVLGSMPCLYAISLLKIFEAPNTKDLTLMNMSMEDFGAFIRTLEGKFPLIQILTLYALEVTPSPSNKGVVARWLISMPWVKLLRLSQLKQFVSESLFDDVRRYHPQGSIAEWPIERASDSRMLVFPRLKTVEYVKMETRRVVDYARYRANFGQALNRIYVTIDWIQTLSPAEKDLLLALGSVWVSNDGGNSEEEQELWRQNGIYDLVYNNN